MSLAEKMPTFARGATRLRQMWSAYGRSVRDGIVVFLAVLGGQVLGLLLYTSTAIVLETFTGWTYDNMRPMSPVGAAVFFLVTVGLSVGYLVMLYRQRWMLFRFAKAICTVFAAGACQLTARLVAGGARCFIYILAVGMWVSAWNPAFNFGDREWPYGGGGWLDDPTILPSRGFDPAHFATDLVCWSAVALGFTLLARLTLRRLIDHQRLTQLGDSLEARLKLPRREPASAGRSARPTDPL